MKTALLRGFTLIELMVALAVGAIVLTIGVPSFQEWIRGKQVTSQTNALVAALNLARGEAIKRGGNNVVLCKRNSSGTACNNSGQWEDGWLLFADSDNNGAFTDDGDTTLCETNAGQLTEDCLIRSFNAPTGVTIRTGNNFNCWMGFQVNGTPRGSGSGCGGIGIGTDTFRICRASSTDTSKARSVVVSNTGRIRTDTAASACP